MQMITFELIIERKRDAGWSIMAERTIPGAVLRIRVEGEFLFSSEAASAQLATRLDPKAYSTVLGDARSYAPTIKAAGCTWLCQIQEVAAAREAVAAGADINVAQVSEAGGHSRSRATLPLVPALVDAVAPVPVLATGGIADGSGLATALMPGAQGVMMGTRFSAATESLTHERARSRLVAARAADTVQTRVFDIVCGYAS
jgi:nitronate monooxygenase